MIAKKAGALTLECNLNQLPPAPASQNPYSPHEPFIPVVNLYPTSSNPVSGSCAIYTESSFTLTNGAVINQGDPAYTNMLAACYEIISLENAANSTYNAFQTTLRRPAGPLTLGISYIFYTYRHSLDNSSDRSDAMFVNAYDLASNKRSPIPTSATC